ncbi:hypothetical protein PAEPH01_0178 [Pancytospora epiphaga]|nr:hypothetical protein PAEPH01_0178 [Pancytospora epiphaga]
MKHSKAVIQRVFGMFADGNGMLSEAFIPDALRCLGFVYDNSYPRPVDLDGFRCCVEEASNKAMTRDQVEAAFKAIDQSNTGYINSTDLQNILASGDDALSSSDIQSLLGNFAPNEQGMICYTLFIDKLFA